MKNTFRYIFAAAAVLAAFSCTKQEEMTPEEGKTPVSTYEYLLNVTHENDTKTTMDGVQILWSADDKIGVTGTKDGTYADASVFGGEKSMVDAENYSPSGSATFDLAFPDDGAAYKPIAVVYPYYKKAKVTSGKSVNNGTICNVEIPATQTGVKGNIPVGAMPMTGLVTADNQCQMVNCGAVIKFELTREDVTSIVFQGNNSEKIAGESYHYIKIDKDDTVNKVGDVVKEKPLEGSSTVTLVPSGTVFEKGVYYFVVAPAELTEGFSITLTAHDGSKATRSTSTPFNIERNHKYVNFGSDSWFKKISTGAAGDLGSADGTTATLYAVVSGTDIAEGDEYGLEISTDGEIWKKYDGTISRRTSVLTTYNVINLLSAPLTGLEPATRYYYRAYYTNSIGVTTRCQTKSFQTYANAESAIIDLYNGFDTNYWPFKNIECDKDIVKGTSTAALHKGEEIDLTTKSGFAFTAKAAGGVWLGNSNGCLTMNTAVGDYIKFPVIEGKKPASVTMVIGSKNSKNQGLPSICEFGEGSATPVATQWDGSSAAIYDSHTWNINATAGNQYGIYFNAKNNFYISYLEIVYVDANVKPAKIEQNLLFYSGSGDHGSAENKANATQSWPFSEGGTTPPTYDKTKEMQGPFATVDQPNIEYLFKVQNHNGVSDRWRITGQGFRFGGTVGDYMLFPALQDYKLTYVKIRGGAKKVYYSITSNSDNATTIDGGATQNTTTSFDSEVEFTLDNTSESTAYRLVLGNIEPTAIREMWITYELVK